MTKQSFKPNIEEDLNRPHNITLTEGQISTILYIVEGYLQGSDDGYDPEFREDIDNIFIELEGVVDTYYETRSDDYASKVDSLIDKMQYSRAEQPVHKVSTRNRIGRLDAL